MYIRRPCGCRCVQYSILGGKAQGVRAIFLRQWIFSFAVSCLCRPHPPAPLPLRGRGRPRLFHARGFAPCIPGLDGDAALARRALAVPGGGLPSLSPADPAFGLLYCPIPPTRARRALFPAGRGRPRLFHARGFVPCIPGIKPLAALVHPAPGERTISNAEVPLPRSPLSLAAGTVLRTGFLSVLRRTGDAEDSPPGRIPDWQVEPVPRGFSPGGARGGAPCIRKLKVSPFPPGRGSGG